MNASKIDPTGQAAPDSEGYVQGKLPLGEPHNIHNQVWKPLPSDAFDFAEMVAKWLSMGENKVIHVCHLRGEGYHVMLMKGDDPLVSGVGDSPTEAIRKALGQYGSETLYGGKRD